jgi:hypothetical protein
MRHARFVVTSALAFVACGKPAPPPPATPPTPAAATSATPSSRASGEPAPAGTTAPAASGPEVDVIETADLLKGLPGPTCEGALKLPMPGHEEDRPQIRIGAVQVNGRVAPAEIISAVKAQARGSLARCSELATKDPANESRVAPRFIIKEDGSVILPETADVTAEMKEPLYICARDAVKSVKYPKPSQGIVTVVLPLHFRKTTFAPDRDQLEEWSKKVNAPCKKKR